MCAHGSKLHLPSSTYSAPIPQVCFFPQAPGLKSPLTLLHSAPPSSSHSQGLASHKTLHSTCPPHPQLPLLFSLLLSRLYSTWIEDHLPNFPSQPASLYPLMLWPTFIRCNFDHAFNFPYQIYLSISHCLNNQASLHSLSHTVWFSGSATWRPYPVRTGGGHRPASSLL